MRFSIQEEGKEKQLFHTFFDATKATGLDSRTIWAALKREDSRYRRRSDKKVFFIQEKRDEKILIIDGEEVNSFEILFSQFGMSPTRFFNQVSRKKRNFIGKDGNQHTVEWFSPEVEKRIDLKKQSNKNKVFNKKLMKTKENDLKTKPTITKIELP